MRYFTKEWYNNNLVSDICFQFRKTDKAAVYSDAFFEHLYLIEQKAYLKFSKRHARASRTKYDQAAAIAEFEKNYRDNLAFVQNNLPQEILSEISDLRVLALGSVTPDMALKITRYCGNLDRKCEAIQREYDHVSEEVDEKLGGRLSHTMLSIMDGQITSIETEDCHTTIMISSEADGSALKITLQNSKQIELDEDIIGTTVLQYELLVAENPNDGYEFSALAMGADSLLRCFTYTAQMIHVEK